MDAIQFVNKWLHLLSIIGVLGGIMFAAMVLRAAPGTPGSDYATHEDEGAKLRWKRWGIAQAVLWVVVLATGFANYAFISPGVIGRYHMLVGMKISLAVLMFLIALALAHPVPALAGLVRKRSTWLGVLVILGVIVVGISAYLNIGRVKRTLTKPAAAVVEQSGVLPEPPNP